MQDKWGKKSPYTLYWCHQGELPVFRLKYCIHDWNNTSRGNYCENLVTSLLQIIGFPEKKLNVHNIMVDINGFARQ